MSPGRRQGGMRERTNRTVSKTVVAQATVGSNPTPSASARPLHVRAHQARQDRDVHIVVVGAGEVGEYVCERVTRQGHDVALVERDPKRLRAVQEHLDVLAVLGNGASPHVLEDAGIDKAGLLVAVTNSDEVNLLASLLAKQAGVETSIVRLQEADHRESEPLREAMGVDLVIDPDLETALEIIELLEFPGVSEVAQMAGGEVVVIGARLPEYASAVGRTLQQIALDYEPNWEFLFGVITRGNETVIPRGNHELVAGDHVRVVCKRRARAELLALLGLKQDVPRQVMLLGGGRTAELVANRLQRRDAKVTLVERDRDRADELAEHLDNVTVIHGEITDADLLDEEGVGHADAVVALTGEDDANILACLYARAAGARETVAVVHRLSLLPLLHDAGVDVALSPRTASANAVMRYVRGGTVAQVATFLEGEAEVLELEVKKGTVADGAMVAELHLPKDVLIGAIVRDGKAQIARGRSTLRAHDHLVVFAMPQSVEAAKQLFS